MLVRRAFSATFAGRVHIYLCAVEYPTEVMCTTESWRYFCVPALGFALVLTGCGNQSTPTSTPPPNITVSINMKSVSLQEGSQQQFAATVKGTTNTAVVWSVDSKDGGNSGDGTITAAGLYTAPIQSGTHRVTATSQADASQSASATVTVMAESVSISISPTTASLGPRAQQQFTASVSGTTNTAVTWSVDSQSGGSSNAGTITAAGLYTAPAQAGTHTVTATSQADSSKGASASITVAVSVTSISVTPSTATLIAAATQQFTATAQDGSSPSVNWSVDGVAGGNSTVGTITNAGLYTAPSQYGSHTIAASFQTVSGDSSVAVFTIAVAPASVSLAPSGTESFSANVQGISNTAVMWSVDGNPGGNSTVGTIDSTGKYTAPAALGMHTIAATSAAYTSFDEATTVTVINSKAGAVLTYHNDDARDGVFAQETTLMPSNVNSAQFGKVASYPVDGQIYGQPLFVPQLNIASQGTHDVVFVATQNNSVYAFDADAKAGSTTTFWQKNFGTPVNAYDAYGPWPTVGILSTPVIDATTNTMYIVAHTAGTNPEYWLHALDITTGDDKVTAVGIHGSYGSDSLGNGCYQRMGLALDPVTNWIYVPIGSCPNGWVMAYDKTSLAQTGVFLATPGAQGGGFWSSGGAAAIDDSTGDVYLMNGVDSGDEQWINGNSMIGYNDAFLRLNAKSLSVLDYFAPSDNYTLAVNDVDLGSGSNILVPGSSTYPHITIGGGKDGNIFVVNRDSMGGFNDSSNNVIQTVHIGTSQYNNIFSTPVYWNGNIYFHSNGDVLRQFTWNGQYLSSSAVAVGANTFKAHGATASISSNGTNNGIIWEIDNSTYVGNDPSTSGTAVLHAYDATNVAKELYNSTQAGSRDTPGLAQKLTVPTIAGGKVFVGTQTELDIYGLLN